MTAKIHIEGPRGKRTLEMNSTGASIEEAREVNSYFFKNLASKLKQYTKNERTYWAIYDSYFLQVALPYTEYQECLKNIGGAQKVWTENASPIQENLVRSWCQAHHISYQDGGKSHKNLARKMISWSLDFNLGLLSLIFFIYFYLRFRHHPKKLAIWTGDHLSSDKDYDVRLGDFYPALRNTDVPYLEFVRSSGLRFRTLLKNLFRRSRPVIYYQAVHNVLTSLNQWRPLPSQEIFFSNPQDDFLFRAALNFCPFLWSLEALLPFTTFLFKKLKPQSLLVWFLSSRTALLNWAAQDAGIKTVGIMHGLSHLKYMGHEYMPEYSGHPLGPDVFGVWGEHWLQEFREHSKIYGPQALRLSGPLRPIKIKSTSAQSVETSEILFISEQSLDATEAIPYLNELLQQGLKVKLKIRNFGNDLFYSKLKALAPHLLQKLELETRSIEECLPSAHVVVGTHSTILLEACSYGIPVVFYHSKKWGDLLQMKKQAAPWPIFAQTPADLTHSIGQILQQKNPMEMKAFCQNLALQYFGPGDGAQWLLQECLD